MMTVEEKMFICVAAALFISLFPLLVLRASDYVNKR